MSETETHTLSSDRLNVGCGTDIRPGFVNLDIAPLPGVDVVHDLDRLPLPFDDGAFREIVCKDVLEHVELADVLRDLHRILQPGGRLHVTVPHFSSVTYYIDPTHRKAFATQTFQFFAHDGLHGDRSYYFDFHFRAVESTRILFHKHRLQPWNYLVEPFVNASPRTQSYYEETGMRSIFPGATLAVTLVK